MQHGNTGLVGHRTDDDLTWNGSSAVLIGGAGDDTLTIDNKDFNRIDGGSGEDKLVLDGIGLNFTNGIYHTSIQDIEEIDMMDSTNTLSLRPIDLVNLSTTSNQLTVSGGNLHLYQGPTDGAGWYNPEGTNRWENYVNNTVINIVENVNVNKNNLMKTIEDEFDSINITTEGDEKVVNFGAADGDENNHYLTLDDRVYDGRDQLSIEMEFELSFERAGDENDEKQHAYLLSLAENDDRDNMLSIFLKHRDHSSQGYWDLSIWVMNDDANEKKDQRIVFNKDWITENNRVVLWVAINLYYKTIYVYSGANRDDLTSVTNQCSQVNYQSDSAVCQGSIGEIGLFEVGKGGAVFGNDQDKLAGEFNHEQAFEGKFYSLKIYDKSIDPITNSIPEDDSLIYSLSPGNIASN